MPSFSIDNQFTTNVEDNNKVVAIIKGLFLNIRYRSFSERLMEKAVHETCEFFMHSVKYISFKNQIALCKIKKRLKPFQALEIFLIIFIHKIGYGTVRYQIF